MYWYVGGRAAVSDSPAGTSFHVVISRGCDWLRTGPTSEAQVSPLLQAKAPSRDRHIQEAEYCLPKSMAISPGPTCREEDPLSSVNHTFWFCSVLWSAAHLDHVEQGQLRRDASVTEDLDPVALTVCNTNSSHRIDPKPETAAFRPLTFSVLRVDLLLLCSAPAGQSG